MAQAQDLISQVLDGKYRLDRLLGRGGMGSVYLGTHLGTDRVVAVKVIAPRYGAQAEFVERFRREARAAGRLRHPNVVDVTDFGFSSLGAGRVAYLVMDYLDGCTLAEVLRDEGRLPLSWAVEILDQVCSAVDEAHRQGIVHRDLKPDNLWLEPDRRGGFTVKVLDFGLAKLAETGSGPASSASSSASLAEVPTLAEPAKAETRPAGPERTERETLVRDAPTVAHASPATTQELTRVGEVLGTPLYMSPEQCRGEALDARSDIYSLGVVAYRMLAGEVPFSGDPSTVIRRHVEETPPPLRGLRRDVPRPVAELIMSALEKDPARRPPSAAAFTSALRARAESLGAFLRQILTLLGDRYATFLKISILAHTPLVLLSLLALGCGLALGGRVPVRATGTFGLVLMLAVLGAMMAGSALSEAVVMQLLVAPLRPIRLAPLVQGLRRRIPGYARTLAPLLLAILAIVLLLLVPKNVLAAGPIKYVALFFVLGIVAWAIASLRSLWFLGQVVVIEGLEGRAARARSTELVRQAERLLANVRAVSGLIFIPPFLAGVLLAPIGALLIEGPGKLVTRSLGPMGVLGVAATIFTAASILCLPLLTVPTALFYFRTREAGGETLREILSEFETDVLPPDSWQMRMRDRIREGIRSGPP